MLTWQVLFEVLITLGNLIFVVHFVGEIRRNNCCQGYVKKSRIKTLSPLLSF